MQRHSLMISTALVVLVLAGVIQRTVSAEIQLYWTDKDSANLQDVLTWSDGLSEPRGLAIDYENSKIYWADNGTGKIQRANLDGSQIEDIVTTGLNFPADVEIDTAAGKIYWADLLANLDGSGVEVLWAGLNLPYYMTLNTDGGTLYWAENDSTNIHWANLDGSNHQVMSIGLARIRDLVIDPADGKIYWGDREASTIQSANLDGTGVQILYDAGDGLDRPHGLAIDTAEGVLYWTDTRTYAIHRGSTDGAEPAETLVGGLAGPWDIVIVPEPATVILLAMGAVALRKKR